MEQIEMTDLEKDLKELIGARRGAGNAISRARLMELFDGIPERAVRRAIKHLVMRHRIPIASGSSGYFTPVTQEEKDAACRYYHSYAMASLMAESSLKGCSVGELLGQLQLSLTDRAEKA